MKLCPYLRKMDSSQQSAALEMEPHSDMACRTELSVSVVINGKLYCVWQKRCLSSMYEEAVMCTLGTRT